MKQYTFVEPSETREEITKTLMKALERSLTEQEVKTIYWLGDCEYETRGILTSFFNELLERIEYFKED